MTFHRTLLILAAALGLGAATQSQAAIVVTLPTATVAGSIVITDDINFTITTAGQIQGIILDEWVTSNGTQASIAAFFISPDQMSYSINGGSPATASWSGFFDNFSSTFGSITPNDGYFWSSPITVTVNDVFTLKSAAYNLAPGSLPPSFNPQAEQTFTGEAFLISGSTARLSANTPVGGAVPEPGTAALGVLAGLTLLRRRR